MRHSNCLILNSDYTPLCIIDWQRAIILSYKSTKNVQVLEFYENESIYCANNKKAKVPSVIKLEKYVNIYKQSVNFSRKNLFIRDNFTCQYCRKRFSASKLTYDHVVPKSLWTENRRLCTTWSNVVTSCKPCNLKKSNKKLESTNMKLAQKPYAPNNSPKYLYINYVINNHPENVPDSWKKYTR